MRKLVLYAMIVAMAAGCKETIKQAFVPGADQNGVGAVAPAEKKPVKKIKHLAVGAKVVVSSTQQEWEGEGPPKNLLDGDPATRWSSEYKDGQEVVIDLGRVKIVTKVRLLWETAAAKTYAVSLSSDGEVWKVAGEQTGGQMGPRTDVIDLGGMRTRFIRLDLLERATEWGFSLYEIEVR